jgi:hypothetical protein
MTINQYILQCEQHLNKLEQLEHYERCQDMYDLINALKSKDKKRYIDLSFDIDGLVSCGFLKPKSTYEEIEKRIIVFFHLKSIFDYSIINGGINCSFYKNLNNG